MSAPRATIRLDKWLWYARFFKTRGLATKHVSAGHVRVNSDRVTKPATAVGEGDTLTFAQGNRVRVVRIRAAGSRRGPAPEAQMLYDDLTPPPDPRPATSRVTAGPPPSRKERRTAAKLRGFDLD